MPAADDEVAQRQAFGDHVRQLRKMRGFSQEELANASNLDRTYIGSLETGRRNVSLKAIWQLAGALSVSPAVFFLDVEQTYRNSPPHDT